MRTQGKGSFLSSEMAIRSTSRTERQHGRKAASRTDAVTKQVQRRQANIARRNQQVRVDLMPNGRRRRSEPSIKTRQDKTRQDKTRQDTTRHDTTRHDTTRHDTTRHDTTRHDTTRHDTTRQDKTRHDTTRHDTTRHDTTRHDTTRHDTTRHDTTRHDTTRHDTTRHDTTRHDTTRHDKTRQDKTRQDKTRQDKTRQDKTRQDKTRQDKTRQDKTRQDCRQLGTFRESWFLLSFVRACFEFLTTLTFRALHRNRTVSTPFEIIVKKKKQDTKTAKTRRPHVHPHPDLP